jgi:probable rRNA maturation factor
MSLPADSPRGPAEPAAAPEPGALSLSLSQEAGDWPNFKALEGAVASLARALVRHPGAAAAAGGEAGVVLGDDALLRGLNATYRGKDAPTNVLAFPFQPRAIADREAERYLGDVLLAAETIAREAAERQIEPIEHVQHLIVHGVLHLIGYDHATDAEAAEMERLESEILTSLGLKDPYLAIPGQQ